MKYPQIMNWTLLLAVVLLLVLPIPAFRQCGETKHSEPNLQKLPPTLNGEQLFKAYCASCHGSGARGDGPVAKTLKVKVPDLTMIARRSGGVFPAGRVRNSISGENRPAAHGTSRMPVWGPYFSQVEEDTDYGKVRIDNLARYLESIQR